MNDVIDVTSVVEIMPSAGPTINSRADEVRAALLGLKDSIEDNFFTLCDLLLEAQENDYHAVWGYIRFGDWVEQGSDLDLSARSAYYFINIAKKARTLGMTREQLKQAKVSKLKEIFSLDPEENSREMKALVAACADKTLEEIKEKVRKIKVKDGKEDMVNITIKVSTSVKETIDRAFELARKNYGDVLINGEPHDATPSQCMELISVSYVNDPNNQGVQG